jgi:hypothetical protein
MTQGTLFDTPSEAQQILDRAHAREDARAAARVPIDYPRAKEAHKRLKTMLTRAVSSGDRDRVVLACKAFVDEFDQPGMAWPDDWSTWQRALDDACGGWPNGTDLRDLR